MNGKTSPMSTSKCLLLGTLAASLAIGTSAVSAHSVFSDEALISLTFQDKPLGEVVRRLAEDLDYSIEIDAASSSTIVSGDYNGVPIDQFFDKVLGGRDYILIEDKQRRWVFVKAYLNPNHSGHDVSFPTDIAGGRDVTPNPRLGDQPGLMSLESANEIDDVYSTPFQSYHLSRMGGIEELDTDLPITESADDKHIIDSQTGLPWNFLDDDRNSMATEFADYDPSRMGGINELDNNLPIIESGNDKHIIDSQTGLPWSMVDELN